ncbi:uncharacterized protein LOC119649623 isoform X1 [Hermetia illucens]|uniref:uncharacterized protein LOC119649623 isoform X1 n=1 Tax=Hermetia illucens TaxID=343691 RepID=UPI0018CC005D|nr:uncharacterized protein LOC119649623 isoform X1 [Hermetia illucens]
MASCLRRIAEEINKRTNFNWDLPYKDEFVKLLLTLDCEEKLLLNKYFRTLEWNVGSSTVLVILQNCKVITASEYILTQEDDEHVQLVLNDFLEAKFELLADILRSCYYDFVNSSKLTIILEECFGRLFRDLCRKPNLMDTNYISELKAIKLEGEIMTMLKQMHVNALLQEEKTTLKNALSNLHVWRATVPKGTFLHTLLSELIEGDKQMAEYVFKKTMEPDFEGWKYYVVLISVFSENCDSSGASEIKKHIKELFKQFVKEKDLKLFYTMLLTARIVYSGLFPNFETYQQWFKTTIGEMNYSVNAQEFKSVMSALTDALSMEAECSFLEVQTNTAISAPPLCNQLVLIYKKRCRRRLALLKNEDVEPSFDMDESIIIDD